MEQTERKCTDCGADIEHDSQTGLCEVCGYHIDGERVRARLSRPFKIVLFGIGIALLCLSIAITTSDWSYGNTSPSIEYKKNPTGYMVVGVKGKWSDGFVEIPAVHRGKPVKSIATESFFHLDIRRVSIPSSVTEIGSRAFYLCTSLEEITIPESVTKMGSEVFYFCINLTDIYVIGHAERPSGWDTKWSFGTSATVHWGQ